jgi:serine phosphatase RsbU (regulator of sigma subunit)
MAFSASCLRFSQTLSDGVPEARSHSNELFGFDRLSDLTRLSAEEIAGAAQNFGQENDITVLALKLAL